MIDLFVILTPFLVLGVICLLGFVGCAAILGLGSVSYEPSATPATLTITTPSLPAAMYLFPYGFTMHAEGGVGDYTWSYDVLPGGLSLSNKGVFGGAPKATGTSPVQITVQDSANPPNKDTKPFSLVVKPQTIAPGPPPPPAGTVAAVTRVFQEAQNKGANAIAPFTATYTAAAGEANFLVLVSVHWEDSGGTTAQVTVNGAAAKQFESDFFNPQTIAHYYANGLGGTPINVSVGLSTGSITAWDFCITIYKNADQSGTPYDSPTGRQGSASGAIPDAGNQFNINSSVGNLIYAAAVSQAAGGLGGNLSVGAGFAEVASPIKYFLVEELPVTTSTAEPVVPTATVAGAAQWYFFAVEIKHA